MLFLAFVVIVFYAFVGLVYSVNYVPFFSETAMSQARPDSSVIRTLLKYYKRNNGFFPTTEQGLSALVKIPSTEPIPGHWTALADRVPRDPWGQEYHYECDDPFSKDPMVIRIISSGKDGTLHTEDDLNLSEEKPLTFRERLNRWLSF